MIFFRSSPPFIVDVPLNLFLCFMGMSMTVFSPGPGPVQRTWALHQLALQRMKVCLEGCHRWPRMSLFGCPSISHIARDQKTHEISEVPGELGLFIGLTSATIRHIGWKNGCSFAPHYRHYRQWAIPIVFHVSWFNPTAWRFFVTACLMVKQKIWIESQWLEVRHKILMIESLIGIDEGKTMINHQYLAKYYINMTK